MAGFGDWKVKNAIGEGGQGQIFLVTKNDDEKLFVLKKLRNKSRIGRFEDEVEAARALNHPNIVKLVDFNIDADSPYIVFEYYENGSMEEFLPENDIHLTEILEMFRKFYLGVAYVHENGFVHRDLKPENIFIANDGRTPVVGDFGLCYIDNGERITITEEAVGSRQYIAPEFEAGRTDAISPASDVYSLGKILYWMMAGRHLTREDFLEENRDLTKFLSRDVPDFYLINELLGKLINRNPTVRLANADIVHGEVEKLLIRITKDGRPIRVDPPQRCKYCEVGIYHMKDDPTAPAAGAHGSHVRNIGFTSVGNSKWLIFVCDTCGHVQSFRLDSTETFKGWMRRDPD
ncbi:MAG: serine/threonine protein kinase [Deltaproteobacteria bacterium]|nr:serine/threonine protein kinase [Deltaproteobacteria bacterium]